MIGVFAAITVSFVIFELAVFVVLFWRSVDKDPYSRWPRFQSRADRLPESRGVTD